jgi:hypothetical protein
MKLDLPTLKTYLWMPRRCAPENKRPAAEGYDGWFCPGVYMKAHPTDPALALFICPHCGREEWTYPTYQTNAKRWRPGDRDLY